MRWLLDNSGDGMQQRAEAGELAFGTVDSWLIHKLTSGARHVIDATNASRTMLYNVRDGDVGRPHARGTEHPAGDAT